MKMDYKAYRYFYNEEKDGYEIYALRDVTVDSVTTECWDFYTISCGIVKKNGVKKWRIFINKSMSNISSQTLEKWIKEYGMEESSLEDCPWAVKTAQPKLDDMYQKFLEEIEVSY